MLAICGDSFGYGTEQNTWPKILADKLNMSLLKNNKWLYESFIHDIKDFPKPGITLLYWPGCIIVR